MIWLWVCQPWHRIRAKFNLRVFILDWCLCRKVGSKVYANVRQSSFWMSKRWTFGPKKLLFKKFLRGDKRGSKLKDWSCLWKAAAAAAGRGRHQDLINSGVGWKGRLGQHGRSGSAGRPPDGRRVDLSPKPVSRYLDYWTTTTTTNSFIFWRRSHCVMRCFWRNCTLNLCQLFQTCRLSNFKWRLVTRICVFAGQGLSA